MYINFLLKIPPLFFFLAVQASTEIRMQTVWSCVAIDINIE